MDVFDLRMDWKIGRLEVREIAKMVVLSPFQFSILPENLKVVS